MDLTRRPPQYFAALVLSGIVGGSAQAADGMAANLGHDAFPEGVHKALVDRVNASQTASYADVLKEFDRYLSKNPADAVAAVEKCKFIGNFADQEDQTVASSSADLEACVADLADKPIEATEEARLYHLESEWGEDGIRDGEALLIEANAKPWSQAHRAALHEHLYSMYSNSPKQSLKAGEHAVAAVHLNPESKLRLAAAEYLVKTGAHNPALALLTPTDTVKWSEWQVGKVATLLIKLGNLPMAREVIERQSKGKLSVQTRVLLAGLLANAGEVDGARSLLAQAASARDSNGVPSVQTLRERFRLERDYGDRDSMAAAYRDLRNRGWSADPLARDRLSLFFRHPLLVITGGDLLGLATLLATLIAAALLPVVVIAPIHYRSAVKQAHGTILPPPGPWGLGHLWYALGAMIVSSLISIYVLAYSMIEAEILSSTGIGGSSTPNVPNAADTGRVLLLQSAIMLVALLPVLMTPAQRKQLRGQWSIAKSVLAGAGCSLGMLVVAGMVVGVWKRLHLPGAGITLGSATTQALQGIRSECGLLTLLVVVCVIVPIIEEVVFRGVFLQAVSRRLALWAAIALQAIVFAVLHEEPGVIPAIFVLALVAAWLARRSAGLLAPIVLHGTNNAFAVLVVARMTALLNGT